MHLRTRAASLCAAALFAIALIPAAAQAQTQAPAPVIDNSIWPSTLDGSTVPTNPDLISAGSCDPGTGTATFTYQQTAPVVLRGEQWTFSEQGTFTIARVDGVVRVTDLDATVSGGSATGGTLSAERHLAESQIANTEVRCSGTTAADRDMTVIFYRLHSDVTLTSAAGDAASDHGWMFLQLSDWAKPTPGGFYFGAFSSDQDRDEHRYIEDNCRFVANPDQKNSDGDNAGDACDGDDDNDGRADGADNCQFVPNFNQADADQDGIGDVCDPVHDVFDSDGDGVVDTADNCVSVPNPDQADTGGTSRGDACEDRDGDGVGDLVDNCVDQANGAQANLDGDALGDVCDPDDDGDTVLDGADNCPSVANGTQRDSDADGAGDACDGAFDSTEGFVGGGGKLPGSVHVSVALHSQAGLLHGSGQLADGSTTVKLLDVGGLHSDGDRAVAIGTASVNGGDAQSYRLEIVDSTNAFELEIGDRRWAGSLTNGNLVVR